MKYDDYFRVLKALEGVSGTMRDRYDVSVPRHETYPYPHYATSISNGMISGTICEADTDCSDATGPDSAPAAAADDDGGGDPDPEPARRRHNISHPQAIAPTPARAPERRTATATAGESPPPNRPRL